MSVSPIISGFSQDDVIRRKHFPSYWPFVKRINRSQVVSPHKGQWRRDLMFFLYLRPNKRLRKQSRRRWLETPSRWLRRHCDMDFFFLWYVDLCIRANCDHKNSRDELSLDSTLFASEQSISNWKIKFYLQTRKPWISHHSVGYTKWYRGSTELMLFGNCQNFLRVSIFFFNFQKKTSRFVSKFLKNLDSFFQFWNSSRLLRIKLMGTSCDFLSGKCHTTHLIISQPWVHIRQ